MKQALLLGLFLISHFVSATTWHVSGTGDDANDGKTPQTAFRSLQKAADLVQPGDVVLVGNGTYTNADKGNGSAVLNITRSGTPAAWITWKARPGEHPEVRPVGWCGIQILGSYTIIDGLSVIGNNDSIVLLKAQEDGKKPTPDPYFNTNGIFFNGRTNKPDQKPHHLIVRHCVVAKCAGGGIVGIEMDYLTVEDCRVYDNAWFMRYGGSGITTLNNWAYDDAPGYHIIIQRNFVWNNKTLVAWEKIGKLSDGNGILLDVTDQEGQGATNPNADAVISPAGSQTTTTPAATTKPKRPEWNGRALIANNVSCYNGGSGIHTFRTRHVDIINNTTYWNGGIVGYQELFPNRSDDIVILNNVIVPRPGGQVTSNNRNTNIRWNYNVYPTAQTVFVGPNDIVADPGFIDAQFDPTKGNFRLAKGSRAINSGSADVAQPTDILGKNRPKGAGVDRGAFEQ
ncbi:choice-of-anchor Q domain-containing protein [Fibrella sp. WM1]|uniref:choice-of-anchor Q domain-containing protein n=1 Tax=Fibrella musci TaxID=3242485 RepID=UPI0035224388